MAPRLHQQIRESGLGERVELMGRVDHNEAVALLHAAALFVLPSHQRSEAFGICQIEAMTCGLPVIATDLPTGVPEVNEHGRTGLIVPPGDPLALRRAISELLGDPARRRHLLRLWLAIPGARPLPDVYKQRYGSITIGDRGGVIVPGSILNAPLEPV